MLHGRHRLQPDSQPQASHPKTYRRFRAHFYLLRERSVSFVVVYCTPTRE